MQIALHQSFSPPVCWDDLVSSCPWGTFFHSSQNAALVNALTPASVSWFVASSEGAPAGGIAFGVQDGPLGPVVNCLPYFGSYGDALLSPGVAPETENALYDALLDHCRAIGALSLTVITSPFSDTTHHDRVQAMIVPDFLEERLCQATPLPTPQEASREAYGRVLFNRYEGRARTSCRRAVNEGLTVRAAVSRLEIEALAALHRGNIGGKGGVYKTEAFFDLVWQAGQDRPNSARVLLAMRQGSLAGGAVFFRFAGIAEYHTTGMDMDCRSLGPLNLVIHEAMIDAGLSGCAWMNFGGTWKSQDGVYKFKRSFGAVDLPYVYCTRIFRDLDILRSMSPPQLVKAYPLAFVLPFSECAA